MKKQQKFQLAKAAILAALVAVITHLVVTNKPTEFEAAIDLQSMKAQISCSFAQ